MGREGDKGEAGCLPNFCLIPRFFVLYVIERSPFSLPMNIQLLTNRLLENQPIDSLSAEMRAAAKKRRLPENPGGAQGGSPIRKGWGG